MRSPASQLALSPATRLVLALAIAGGVLLRLEGLGRKPLWYDEVATALHVSGRTEAEVRALYDGRPLTAGALLARFQRTGATPSPSGLADVVRTVAVDEPHSGPGYFVLAAAVAPLAGTGAAALRALSAAASVVGLALLYRLAHALFGAREVALAAAALAALSPLWLRYAHEARSYATWTVLVLACCLAVARARERDTPAAWGTVALAVAATLWLQPLTLLVLVALGALAARDARACARFALATSVALLAWSPWVIVCWHARETIALRASWWGAPTSLATLARGWLGVVTSVLYRPDGPGGLLGAAGGTSAGRIAWLALGAAAGALAAAALLALRRTARAETRRFVLLLALVPWAGLVLLDLVLGGRRSTTARYLLPTWLALQLAVAALLAAPGARRRWREATLVAVLALAAATALRTRTADVWWDTDAPRVRGVLEAGRSLRATPDAVVLTDLEPFLLLELAHRLDPETTLRLGPSAPGAVARDDWPRVVLIAPSAPLLSDARRASARAGLRLVESGTRLALVRPDQGAGRAP